LSEEFIKWIYNAHAKIKAARVMVTVKLAESTILPVKNLHIVSEATQLIALKSNRYYLSIITRDRFVIPSLPVWEITSNFPILL
jgi:hypothetical protein